MTELRTKTSELADNLAKGLSVGLVHRSKIIGTIKPTEKEYKPFDAKKFSEAAKKLNFKKMTPEEQDKVYRKHLEEKYGENIS